MKHRDLVGVLFMAMIVGACDLDVDEGEATAPAPAAENSSHGGSDAATADAPIAPAVEPVPVEPVARVEPGTARVEPAAGPDAAPEIVADGIVPAPTRVGHGAARIDPSNIFGLFETLPAISADGQLVATARYHEAEGALAVALVRASSGQIVRSISIPDTDNEGDAMISVRAIDRLLVQRGFVTFRELPAVEEDAAVEEESQDDWDAPPTAQWTDGDLTVHTDPATGGVAVFRDYRLVHQSLSPAQLPNGRGASLMDPEAAQLPIIPFAQAVRISADGQTLAIQLGSHCDCACDIEPFWRVIPL